MKLNVVLEGNMRAFAESGFDELDMEYFEEHGLNTDRHMITSEMTRHTLRRFRFSRIKTNRAIGFARSRRMKR